MTGTNGGHRVVRPHPVAPATVRWIVRTLEEAGYETWAVGGAVRDVLMGVDSVDWDLATRARPPEVRRLFRRTVPLGVEHGTVGVLDRSGSLVEVTTFRRDVETFGRHAVVEFADTLDEDLGRRDFTINAVAWHPLRDEIRDPFAGLHDLERGVLRTVGDPEDRFREDFLRVLRALRFAGRFRLTIAPATWDALVGAVTHLDRLSAERVREELMKVLEKDPSPSGALSLWAASGALERVAPELAAIVGRDVPDLETSLDAWTLACISLDVLPASRPWVRLGALLADIGLPGGEEGNEAEEVGGRSEAGGAIAERGHRRAVALMMRLRFSNAAAERVAGGVTGGSGPPTPSDGVHLRRWLARVGPSLLPHAARIWGARARVSVAAGGKPRALEEVASVCRRLRAELTSGAPIDVDDLALNGRDLIRMGRKPGPLFGEILDALLQRVLEDPDLNRPDVLAALVEQEWPMPDGVE
jgi:tRNA nucleotidyltransferase (CCA-adding enzyme)